MSVLIAGSGFKIKGTIIQSWNDCPKCHKFFLPEPRPKHSGYTVTSCPYCSAMRVSFRTVWKLKPEWQSPEKLESLKEAIRYGQSSIVHSGALALLVKAIKQFEAETSKTS